MQPKNTLLSWNGGKNSAWALHTLRQNPAYNVAALPTTVNEQFSRVTIHGFRAELRIGRRSQSACRFGRSRFPTLA